MVSLQVWSRFTQRGGALRQRSALIQVFERQFQLHFLAYPSDHADRLQRAAVELKEILIPADGVQLQHRLPNRRQRALPIVLRRGAGQGAGRRQRIQRLQRFAVNFAVRQTRKQVENMQMGWDPGGRQIMR